MYLAGTDCSSPTSFQGKFSLTISSVSASNIFGNLPTFEVIRRVRLELQGMAIFYLTSEMRLSRHAYIGKLLKNECRFSFNHSLQFVRVYSFHKFLILTFEEILPYSLKSGLPISASSRKLVCWYLPSKFIFKAEHG